MTINAMFGGLFNEVGKVGKVGIQPPNPTFPTVGKWGWILGLGYVVAHPISNLSNHQVENWRAHALSR